VIQSFTYTYDTRGNRTAKIFADGTAETYGCDALELDPGSRRRIGDRR